MPPEKRTGDAPAQLRITLRYADQKAFVEKFAANVTQGGIFLSSRTPKAVGTKVRFELVLGDGKTRALKGEGVVAWVREFDAEHPNRPHGMGLRFSKLDAESKQVVDRILAFKRERGLKEDTTLPQPAGLTEGSGAFKITEGSGVFAVGNAPAVERRGAEPIAQGSVDVPLPDGLADLDGSALDETLARARAIARRTAGSGELGELEGLLDRATPRDALSALDASRELAALLGIPAPAPRKEAPATPSLRPASAPLPAAETSSTAPDTVPEPIAPGNAAGAATSVTYSAIPVPIESSPPAQGDADDEGEALVMTADEPPIDVTREVVLEAESPFDAEDLGAAELDPQALAEIARQTPPPEDAEPLPPPPDLPPHMHRDDRYTPDETGPLDASQILEASVIDVAPVAPPRAQPPPPPPPDRDAAISAELDDLLDDLAEGGATAVAPLPVEIAPAEASENTSKPEKKGFFSKLFKK